MVFISHNLGVVRRIADEVAVLYAGRDRRAGTNRGRAATRRSTPMPRGCLRRSRGSARRRAGSRPFPGRLPDLRYPPSGCRFAKRCPFATPDSDKPQILRELGDRQVRCTNAEASARYAMAAPERGRSSPQQWRPRRETEPIVAVEGLTKTFALRSGLAVQGLASRSRHRSQTQAGRRYLDRGRGRRSARLGRRIRLRQDHARARRSCA